MGRKIGILGGTFNPIHNGHLALAKTAFEQLSLDVVWFMPSGQTNLKKNDDILPASTRIKMISLAIEEFQCFQLSLIETSRPGITYTYETLLLLEKEFPNDHFYFILGADCLFSIEKWKNPEIIMQKSTLVTAIRDYTNSIDIAKQADYLKKTYSCDIRLLDFPKIEISSSAIRSKLSARESISGLLPRKVEEYINKHYLYSRMDEA